MRLGLLLFAGSSVACGNSTELSFKPYPVEGSTAREKSIVYAENPPNTARPEFGAFVVDGEEGEFDATADAMRVYHTFAMARAGDTLYLALHKEGDFWMYSADVSTPTNPVLLEAFGDQARDDAELFKVVDDYLYRIGTGHADGDDLEVYDLSSPASPRKSKGFRFDGALGAFSNVGSQAVIQEYGLSGMGSDIWHVVNLDGAAGAELGPAATAWANCGSHSQLGDQAFFCAPRQPGPVRIMSIDDPAASTELGTFSSNVIAFGLRGDRAYTVSVVANQGSFDVTAKIFDVSSGAANELDTGTWTLNDWQPPAFNGGPPLVIEDDAFYFVNGFSRFESDFFYPGTLVFTMDGGGDMQDMACLHHYMPFLAAEYPYGNVGPQGHDLVDLGTRLALATTGGGLQVYAKAAVHGSSCDFM